MLVYFGQVKEPEETIKNEYGHHGVLILTLSPSPSLSSKCSKWGLRGREMKASRFETPLPLSAVVRFLINLEVHVVAYGMLLVHYQEQFVPPAVETNRHI